MGRINVETDLTFNQRLKEAGATDDMIALYHQHIAAENRKGQERLLYRCRRINHEKLQKDREKLSCLDYIIARLEQTQTLLTNNGSSE